MAKLSVETGKRRFETAESLYGLFFEDINRSGDGGLYPELLRNRAFDDSLHPDDLTETEDDLTNSTGWLFEYQRGEGAKRWKERELPTEIPAWYAEGAQTSLEREDTLNDRRPAALRAVFEPGGKIYNVGYCGVPVRAGEAYSLYFFAKVEKTVNVTISLEAEEKVLCSGELPMGGRGYVRYDMTLLPKETVKEARLCLSASERGELLLGFISLMPAERNQDVVRLASYAPLFENVRYAAWEPNLIAFDGLDNYAIPTYYVQKLFAENKGTYVLESSQECGRIYAPYLKGGPCLAGSAGVYLKMLPGRGNLLRHAMRCSAV